MKKTLLSLLSCAVLALLVTIGLYQYTQYLNLQRMRESVKSTASTAALQFNANDLNALQVEKDWQKPEWSKVVNQLRDIRLNNGDLKFAYIIRKDASDPQKMIFVADSHSLNPHANTDTDPTNDIDADGDGKIEPEGEDKLSPPNDPYPTVPPEAFVGYTKPFANTNFYEDGWGKVISGYAPIRDKNGQTVAVVVVDIRASRLNELTGNTFYPVLAFFIFFTLFVFIRLVSLRPKMFKEIYVFLNLQRVLVSLLGLSILALFITYGLYRYNLHVIKDEIGNRLMSIASTAGPTFDAKDLDQLHWAKDMQTDAYQRVFRRLNEIKDTNANIRFIYILRPVDNDKVFEFVADSYSNYNLPHIGPDLNGDHVLDESDENVAPGVGYWVEDPSYLLEALKQPVYERDFTTDQWEVGITGYAPIKDSVGVTHGILGVDMNISDIYKSAQKKFIYEVWFFGVFGLLIIVKIALSQKVKINRV